MHIGCLFILTVLELALLGVIFCLKGICLLIVVHHSATHRLVHSSIIGSHLHARLGSKALKLRGLLHVLHGRGVGAENPAR